MTLAITFRLHYWPIFTTVWILFTFIMTYLVALYNNHLYNLFPYISDTGTSPPESCIFGQMLNIGAFSMLITIYIRSRTVELISHRGFPKNYNLWNKFSNILGILSCFGMSLVANFQETSEINVHFIGAFLAFVVGAMYCGIQAYLTWLSFAKTYLKCLRIFLSSLILPLYISTTVCSAISFNLYSGNPLMWRPENQGYGMHLVATFSEWIMAIVMMLYICTFSIEFRSVQFKDVYFTLVE